MIAIQFHQERAQQLLSCLHKGAPIAPSTPGIWAIDDLLALAGICLAAAQNHGYRTPVIEGVDTSRLPSEYWQAEENLPGEILAAIEFYRELSTRVFAGRYEQDFEPFVGALVKREAPDQPPKIIPARGFKSLASASPPPEKIDEEANHCAKKNPEDSPGNA